MGSALKSVAISNMWCRPAQDRQSVYKLHRLSPYQGALRVLRLPNQTLPLPNYAVLSDKSFYHVFLLGHFDLGSANINIPTEQWMSLEDCCTANATLVEAFFGSGTFTPRAVTFIYSDSKNGVYVAVRNIVGLDYGAETYTDPTTLVTSTRTVTPAASQLYLRFYSNPTINLLSWREAAANPVSPVVSMSSYIATQSDYTAFVANANAMIASYNGQGGAVFRMNGFVVNRPTAFLTSYIGTYLSVMFDETVKEISFFTLSAIPTFESIKDGNRTKYLVARASGYGPIDYHADVDFYLVNTIGGTFKGVYLGRLFAEYVRQVTHNAYALDAANVTALLSNNSFFGTTGVVQVMAVVRTSFRAGLAYQAARTEALYRLSYANVINALTAPPNSPMPEWRAPVLENSSYMAIVDAQVETAISEPLAESALGYDSATLVMANPVQPVQNLGGGYFVAVPPALLLADEATGLGKRGVFCYDQGLMVGYFSNDGLDQLMPVPSGIGACDWSEVFNAKPGNSDGCIYSDDQPVLTSTRLAQYGFRVYACSLVGGVPNEVWTDITGSTLYTYESIGTVGNGYTPVLTWDTGVLAADNLYGCVKINDSVLVGSVSGISVSGQGYMQFQIQSLVKFQGTTAVKTQHIPAGMLDVWLNGQSLTPGLDFVVQWPTVTITRVTGPNDADTPVIVYRAYGFCDPVSMQPETPREIGWVQGGYLSVDGQYDVRNDRSIRVVVGGRFYDRSQVNFAEDQTGPASVSGRPYSIADYQIPVENFSNQQMLPYRAIMRDMDSRVIAYMSPLLQGASVPHPFIQQYRWGLYSPFCSAIIAALSGGSFLSGGELSGSYDKATVDGWLTSFLPLLAVDPCVVGYDAVHVIVYPYAKRLQISVTADQYRFLNFVNTNYLGNRLKFSYAITVS